jgi:hypothetical protein
MWSTIVIAFIITSLIRAKYQRLPGIMIGGITIIYCLAAPAMSFWLLRMNDGQWPQLSQILESDNIQLIDLIFAILITSLWAGIISSKVFSQKSMIVKYAYLTNPSIKLISLISIIPVLYLLPKFLSLLYLNSSELIRQNMLLTGAWPWLLLLCSILLPYASTQMAQKRQPTIYYLWWSFVLILSVAIGFRTYVLMALVIVVIILERRSKLKLKHMIWTFLVGSVAFLGVTYIRVSDGTVDFFPVLRRFSLESYGAAKIVVEMIREEGYLKGQTFMMELVSKIPGKTIKTSFYHYLSLPGDQMTFAGHLGHRAGFGEGLTLTPSGFIELYANFGFYNIILLFLAGWFWGRIMLRSTNIYVQVCLVLFWMDFAMGGSNALFDLMVRLFIINFIRYWLTQSVLKKSQPIPMQ